MQRKRIVLLVEDEASIAEPLAEAIAREGFETKVAGTVAESLALAAQLEPDLVLLDVMLPDGSGFDVCRELRQRSRVPIIMLTARGEEADRVVGLELGADDYVVKPFSAREVVARIRAVLRRTEAAPGRDESKPIEIGELRLDPAKREVTKDGEALRLVQPARRIRRHEERLSGRLVLHLGVDPLGQVQSERHLERDDDQQQDVRKRAEELQAKAHSTSSGDEKRKPTPRTVCR